MKKIDLSGIPKTGLPLYEMQTLATIAGPTGGVAMSYITLLPGRRVPTEGFSCHDADEYSFFISGSVYTEAGDFKGDCRAGDGTLIPMGEKHWCENRTDEPCTIVCALIKREGN